MSSDHADNSHVGGSGKRETNQKESARAQLFVVHAERPRLLLIGENAGIAPMLGLAERLREQLAWAGGCWKPLVLLGSERQFPFHPRPSSIIVPGIPASIIACMPLLESWNIPSRLASGADLPGCFDGAVTALADAWLSSRCPEHRADVEIFSCGPVVMRQQTAELAARYSLPYQTAPDDPALSDIVTTPENG
jgi:dihydroorotate dehydrogenase electron transfer subunit